MARRQIKHKNKKPLIVICSEGGKKSSEYCYFNNFKSRNLRIQFSTGNSTDPKGMFNDLVKYIHNEDIESEDNVRIFLVLDTDLSNQRINEIKEIEPLCNNHNIELITSAPTFEIWYVMHYRKNKLKFKTSKDVKKELANINGTYLESMNMYKIIKDKTINAKEVARSLEKQIIKDGTELIKANPHTSIYKVLDAIEKFNNK